MSALIGKTHSGSFEIDGSPISGTLTVEGHVSLLYLRDDEFIADHKVRHGCVLGTLHDLTKVSLFGCLTLSSGTVSRLNQSYNQTRIFPHYVLSGYRHLRVDEEAVTRISFSIDDAPALFHHPQGFGILFNAGAEVAAILKKKDREASLGDDPAIVYFSGRREILKSQTRLGTFTVHNTAFPSPGSADGIAIKNRIRCSIDFPNPILFDTAIGHLLDVGRFLDLVAGRQQNVSDVVVGLDEPDQAKRSLAVDWNMLKTRSGRRRDKDVHPIDVLIDGARATFDFGAVLARWLERNDAWRPSRVQFQENFWQQGSLSVNRIISDANTFDILPDEAFPTMPPLDPAVAAASQQAKALFRSLPRSPERDSALSALGRLGSPTLKKKIAARAALISERLPSAFPELQLVIDEAVNCRNYFVHGSVQSFAYMQNWQTIEFFIDTLEFIFGASDLIDAGWNIQEWHGRGTTMSHPYGAYKVTYPTGLAELKALLQTQTEPSSNVD